MRNFRTTPCAHTLWENFTVVHKEWANKMDVIKVFEELDLLVAPSPAQQDDMVLTKSFKLNMERFLQTARPQSSWAHVFHERMLKSHTIISQEKYTQYVESLKYYIENSEGTITKTQQVNINVQLITFSLTYKMIGVRGASK